MDHRQSINEVAEFLKAQRVAQLETTLSYNQFSDAELKKLIYNARLGQHSLIRGSIAEIETTKKIEACTLLLEGRVDELSKSEALDEAYKVNTGKLVKDHQLKQADVLTQKLADKKLKNDDEKMAVKKAAADKIGMRGVGSKVKSLVKEEISEEEYLSLDEDDKQLYELSKSTLGSYVNKATNSAAMAWGRHQGKKADAEEVDRFTNRHMTDKFGHQDKLKTAIGADNKSISKERETAVKRMHGVGSAVKRLVKEALDAYLNEKEGDAEDKREDRVGEKRTGMTPKEWEGSSEDLAQDKAEDEAQEKAKKDKMSSKK